MDVAKYWSTTPVDVWNNFTRKQFLDSVEYMNVDYELQCRESENKKGR